MTSSSVSPVHTVRRPRKESSLGLGFSHSTQPSSALTVRMVRAERVRAGDTRVFRLVSPSRLEVSR